MQLNREVILTAAFGILDAYGLGDLSMRRLARNLEVAPGALYWHFPSKQVLLGAVADRILTTGDGVSPGGSTDAHWRDRTLAAAGDLVDRLLATRDGAEIVAAALATGTLGVDPVGRITDALDGAPGPDPGLAAWVLVRYLLGAVTELQTARAADTGDAGPDRAAVDRIIDGAGIVLDGVAHRTTGNTGERTQS